MELSYKNKTYRLQVGLGQGVTKSVVILSGIIIFTFIITYPNKTILYPILGFIPSYALGRFMLWQFFTGSFLHQNFTHLLFNVLGLWMFGGPVEKALNMRRFIEYFLVCGAGGFATIYLLYFFRMIPNTLCIGSSASIYGLLLAFSLLYPDQKVLLFFLVPLRARWLAVVFGSLEFMLCFKSNGLSHIGHLGGLLAGLLFLAYTRNITLPRKPRSLKL